MNKQKGFTIIELIVVIAIIAVLAAIVLVNVTSYIAKGKDASVKGNMASMATIAAAYYDDNSSSYINTVPDPDTDLTDDVAFSAGLTAINENDGNATGGAEPAIAQIKADGQSFCVVAKLNDTSTDNDYWCVDSTGYKGAIAAYASCDTTNADCQ